MKKLTFYLAFIILATGCDLLNYDRTIEGEVFVVTRGGDNVSLGLVDIALILKDDFPEVLDNSFTLFYEQAERLNSDLKQQRQIKEDLEEQEIINWQKVLEEAKTKTVRDLYDPNEPAEWRHFSAEVSFGIVQDLLKDSEFKKERIHYHDDFDFWINKYGFKSMVGYKRTVKDLESQNKLITGKVKELAEYMRGEELVGYVAQKYSNGKTNSKGVYNIVIDKRKDYFLVAKGSRTLETGDKEIYFWMLPIERGKEDIKQLFLSNDNILSFSEISELYHSYSQLAN